MRLTASPPLFRIAWRNVRRNVRHSVGSLLAIAVGFVAMSLFDGYVTWLGEDNSNAYGDLFMMGDLLVEPVGASDADAGTAGKVMLGEREQAFIEEYVASRSSEVVGHSPVLFVWGVASVGKSSAQFIAFGHDVVQAVKMRGRYGWNAIAGKPLHLAPENSILLGKNLGGLLECVSTADGPIRGKDGLPIPVERPLSCRRPRVQLMTSTVSGQINVVEPEVVGIIDGGLKDMDTKMIQIPLPLAQRLLDTKGVSYYAIRLRDRGSAAAFSRDLVSAARAKGIALVSMPWKQHAMGDEHRRGVGVLNAFRTLMSLVIVIVAGMSVLTTMARSVAERTREIGTLRSIGFLRRHIVLVFVIEAALLAMVASALGLAASLVITAAANSSGVTYNAGLFAQPIPLAVRYLPWTWVEAAAFLAAVAALASVVPARRAAKARIPEALTHT